jgi:hypothetical protein
MEALYVVHSQSQLPRRNLSGRGSPGRLVRHRKESRGRGTARYAVQVLPWHPSPYGRPLSLHNANSEPRLDHDKCLQLQDLPKRDCRRRTTNEPPANRQRTASETNRRRTRTTRREEGGKGVCRRRVCGSVECDGRRQAYSRDWQAGINAAVAVVEQRVGLESRPWQVPPQMLCERSGRLCAGPGVLFATWNRDQDFGGQV